MKGHNTAVPTRLSSYTNGVKTRNNTCLLSIRARNTVAKAIEKKNDETAIRVGPTRNVVRRERIFKGHARLVSNLSARRGDTHARRRPDVNAAFPCRRYRRRRRRRGTAGRLRALPV